MLATVLSNHPIPLTEWIEPLAQFNAKWVAGHDMGEKPLVTILVDHSASMRYGAAQAAAITVSLLGSALEAHGIAFEVLGFTTNSWRGGQSRRQWIVDNCPPYPGRLCDLLHIIYRDAIQNDDWRTHLHLMSDNEVLKENVDGEALLWAWERGKNFGPSTWICLVISDGAPVDDTTLIQNGPSILWDHLAEVAAQLQALPDVRIGGLGIGYDTREIYRISAIEEIAERAPQSGLRLLESLIWPEPGEVPASPDNPTAIS